MNNSLIVQLTSSLIIIVSVIGISKSSPAPIVYPNNGQQMPTPTPFMPYPYIIPQVPKSRAYRIVIVGDSMVAALGPNANLLRQHLIEYYPENEFVTYNYGFGATSIETLPARLHGETVYNDQTYQSILSQGFDLIIIESFGYNPLSQLSQGDGIANHLHILDSSIKEIMQEKPESPIALMAAIAPNRQYFAQGIYDLSDEERSKWASERAAYIESVIDFADKNELPLINVYKKSLTPNGDGNLAYINPDDHIHPSALGIDLISKTIAEYIFQNNIFPH